MNNWAVVFDWFPSEPIYHRYDNQRLSEEHWDGTVASFTRCGRMVTQWNHETGRVTEHGDWFPIKHALKFCRVCRSCSPEPPVA